ncbi:MAG TPA: DNA-protecting protein DprA [bacterium]|nr:DNA-protecting protein DprA [bacterium]
MNKIAKKYRLGLSLIKGIGSATFQQLLKISTAEELWKLSEGELRDKVGQNLATKIIAGRYEIDIKKVVSDIERARIEYLVLGEKNYPKLLSQIYDPPTVLYFKGEIDSSLLNNSISIVGTRSYSKFGLEITRKLTKKLVQQGFSIISGLAFGIDKAAHQAALEAGGYTVAVLGGPANIPSPQSNFRTYEKIIKSGAVVSEFPLGTEIEAWNFPKRNRIISGLSLGTLVIEAGEKSGALITARSAVEQNREVFAVPWSLDAKGGKGVNRLIKEGKAKLIESIEDILVEFGYFIDTSENRSQELTLESLQINKLEKSAITVLRSSAIDAEELAIKLGRNISVIGSVLVELEIKGAVMKDEGGKWRVVL